MLMAAAAFAGLTGGQHVNPGQGLMAGLAVPYRFGIGCTLQWGHLVSAVRGKRSRAPA
ncbi:protein of unknown function [Candidatus Hydrogenisulfobacillus filiaventi]|uniref:Uncharacterized protein n=1 Tax=Candidatus Hydrogenisulfobacillus filiaventi TaxID=2707344 RepID=A0A6F8ZJU4_9FIRM|nr:protein of unknown function [Candidatus Hydrogenisulfobacillus filiaventi]